MQDTGLLVKGNPGYEDTAQKLAGVALRAENEEREKYLFIALRGGQESNDHHPYYEFLFRENEMGLPTELVSCTRFYYDVAGIEGLGVTGIFIMFAPMALGGLLVFGFMGMVVAFAIAKRRASTAESSSLS